MPRTSRLAPALLALVLAAAACRPVFSPARFQNNQALYEASRREYDRKRWDNAQAGFERLTLELPARDPLLPQAFFWLGKTYNRKHQYLLAAQNFTRLAETFPNDTLADDALLQTARAYNRLWRKPALDAGYGRLALSTYQSLLGLYPNSALAAEAERETARLQQKFATKDYETGMHYFRRKAYDSAIIYFRDVVASYPTTPRARDAYLRLAEAYREIRYREDAREVCETLRERYPGDREVRDVCGAARSAAAAPTP
jgi:outer membrane protein assembly factor BamD